MVEAHDPYAALRLRDYRLLAAGNIVSVLGGQMVAVAIGWELYQRTHSATALGLVGFFQFIPLLVLSIPAGQLIDKLNRKHVVVGSQILLAVSAACLGLASLCHDHIPAIAILRFPNMAIFALAKHLGEKKVAFTDPYIPVVYAIIFFNGIVRSINQPAKSSLLPLVVPTALFSNAITWNTSVQEVCSVVGPTLGGAIVATVQSTSAGKPWAFSLVYLLNALLQFMQSMLLVPIKITNPPRLTERLNIKSVFAGLLFVWNTKVVLAALALDFFAVVLGGATALLPMFANDILHVGAGGLGILRAAPSIGAVMMALLTAQMPPMKKAGRNLLWSVVAFGIATVLFGLSKSFWFSLVMLVLTGAFDNVSVIIRHTLVQLRTPDEMRGRVSAVNSIFIGSSNQLGALESGITAAVFGAVTSVVVGGIGTIVVAVIAASLWREIRSLGPLATDPRAD